MDKQPTFSVIVSIPKCPKLSASLDRTCGWMHVDTFTDEHTGLSALTVHLPKEPVELRTMAAKIIDLADLIEEARAERVAPEPVEQS